MAIAIEYRACGVCDARCGIKDQRSVAKNRQQPNRNRLYGVDSVCIETNGTASCVGRTQHSDLLKISKKLVNDDVYFPVHWAFAEDEQIHTTDGRKRKDYDRVLNKLEIHVLSTKKSVNLVLSSTHERKNYYQ